MQLLLSIFICRISTQLNYSLNLDADAKSLQSTVIGSAQSKKRASPTTSDSNASTAKKPIHQRLGAMTKTWKTAKKTWRTEKVLSITV